MYMDFLDLDLKNDFVFLETDGNLTGGGFILDSPLLNDAIANNSNPADFTKVQNGGGTIMSILKDLAVPAGLLYTQKSLQKNNLVKYENKDLVIEDTVYDKLLTLIEQRDKKKHAIKTRSKREKKRKMSRKNSK
mgnify:CR=1 FL=1